MSRRFSKEPSYTHQQIGNAICQTVSKNPPPDILSYPQVAYARAQTIHPDDECAGQTLIEMDTAKEDSLGEDGNSPAWIAAAKEVGKTVEQVATKEHFLPKRRRCPCDQKRSYYIERMSMQRREGLYVGPLVNEDGHEWLEPKDLEHEPNPTESQPSAKRSSPTGRSRKSHRAPGLFLLPEQSRNDQERRKESTILEREKEHKRGHKSDLACDDEFFLP